MKLLKLTAVILFVFYSINVSAVREEATFGLEQNSKEWKKAELEDWLATKISTDLLQFVPGELFKVYVNALYKTPGGNQKKITNVNLTMIGTVATLVSQEQSKPQLGLFDRVSKLEVTLVVSDGVPQKTVDAMVTMISQRVPVLSKDKIETAVVRLDRPSLTFIAWLKEFKGVLLTVALFGLLLFALVQLLQKVKFKGSFQIGPMREAVDQQPVKNESAPPYMTPVEMIVNGHELKDQYTPTLPVGAQTVVENQPIESLLPETEKSLKLRKIRSSLLTMKISDCVQMAKQDYELGAIAINLLDVDRAAKIVRQLSSEEKKSVIEKTLNWNSDLVSKASEKYIEKIKSYQTPIENLPQISKKLAVYLDQVGPEAEEKVFNELLAKGEFEKFAAMVRDAIPTQLLSFVPGEVLKVTLTHLSHDDRLELLAFAPADLQEKIWENLPDTTKNVKSIIKKDVERRRSDIRLGDPVPHQALGRLVCKIREALRKNVNWSESVRPHIEGWIYTKTKGVEGRPHVKKAA